MAVVMDISWRARHTPQKGNSANFVVELIVSYFFLPFEQIGSSILKDFQLTNSRISAVYEIILSMLLM